VADKEGYICLWSALYFYDLTEEFVEESWVMVPYKKIIRRDGIKCVRTREGDWEHGIVQNRGFKISSIERTLIDSFLNKRHISLKDAIAIAKLAIKNKKTTLGKIVKLTTEMGVLSSLKAKLELVS
jgi:predicted transcriptional regulator of viral defense system